MAQTSGYSTFNLDITDCMEDAYERVGRELRSGYDAITARRSLNLLTQELTNRGVNLWTVEQDSFSIVAGQPIYQLTDDTSDVLPDAVIRRPNTPSSSTNFDFPCTRWQRDQYLAMPIKSQTGRPYYFLLERLRDNPQLTFWPVPDALGPYTFVYWRVRYIQNDDDGSQSPDMPRRFLPVIVSGLAYYIANKAPDLVDAPRRAELKQDFEDQLKYAQSEDHDRAATYLTPQLRRR